MKKIFSLSLVVIALAVTGCFSMPETNRSSNSIAAVSTLKPDDVVDKTFTGTDKDGTYSYQLLADGTLLYTLNGNSYN
jgi:hypothetical protein